MRNKLAGDLGPELRAFETRTTTSRLRGELKGSVKKPGLLAKNASRAPAVCGPEGVGRPQNTSPGSFTHWHF